MTFNNFNLNANLQKGLDENGYKVPTKIQNQVIPIILQNKSVIASSKTGSGKTLAFLIPIIEKLLKMKWSKDDGLGAIILTPTRELAIQIFETLNKIGKYTNLSAGTIIGGIEKDRISKEIELAAQLSIIVATPGRFLHIIQDSYYLNANNLQFLVLDEADKMVEMGFKEDIEEIIEFINKDRQNLLFSATPNSIVKKIKCLDMKSYEIVFEDSVPEKVPKNLKQMYFKVKRIDQKINLLYECVLNNIKRKAIIFFSTCKETKFFFLLFSRLFAKNKDRTKFYILNGNMKQEKRIEFFDEFQNSRNGILFCTDLGSRGLDFKDINLVVQFDCPESVETYYHRIGRTARNEKAGTGILYLLDGESKLIKDIEKGKSFRSGITVEKKNESDEHKNIISERHHNAKKDIKQIIRKMIKDDSEIEIFASKYLKTYRRFLELNNKRYFGQSFKEIDSLRKWLDVDY